MARPRNDLKKHQEWFKKATANLPRVDFLKASVVQRMSTPVDKPKDLIQEPSIPTPESAGHSDSDSDFWGDGKESASTIVTENKANDGMPASWSTEAGLQEVIVLDSSDSEMDHLKVPERNSSQHLLAGETSHDSLVIASQNCNGESQFSTTSGLSSSHIEQDHDEGSNEHSIDPDIQMSDNEILSSSSSEFGLDADSAQWPSSSNTNSNVGTNTAAKTNRDNMSIPRVVYSQSVVPTAQSIGPLLTERIGLLERKVAILAKALAENKIEVNTLTLDEDIAKVVRRIDDFNGSISDPIVEDHDTLRWNHEWVDVVSSSPKHPEFCELEHIDDLNSDDMYITGESAVHPRSCIDETSAYFNSSSVDQSAGLKRGSSEAFRDDWSDTEVLHSDAPVLSQSRLEPPPQNEVSQLNFPWSKDVMHILRNKFGLSGFRPNQLAAINETLAGRDVVVLMPTGGGKSLCYQLPALVNSGTTRGTTVVISPLISLMQDQVYHLKNRNIEAEMINSQLSYGERSAAFSALCAGNLQLVYMSPEMLSASGQMNTALHQLFNENKLARIVIDEAHCVSQWGHDFRPDYKELEQLKNKFPGLPIMALTATANNRVLLDIVGCVRPNPLELKQSFNRPNLVYEVRPKRRGVMEEVAAICKEYEGKSGILYCHSKKACEDAAADLQSRGIKAMFYHAGMSVESRQTTQKAWQDGVACKVVCATIAFGMGIDKPDVRFVVHMTLPRNVEGYYQETGRAGRDGKRSLCVLFYTYGDAQLLMKMIDRDENLSPRDKENHRNMLTCVVQYCMNETDCRRCQVLQYFSEKFDAADCHRSCDNCRNLVGRNVIERDLTEEAKLAVGFVQAAWRSKVTTLQCAEVLLGRSGRRITDKHLDRFPEYGKLAAINRTELERLLHHLVAEKVLTEFSIFVGRYPQTYIKPGELASDVSGGSRRVFMAFTDKPISKPSSSVAQKPARSSRSTRSASTSRVTNRGRTSIGNTTGSDSRSKGPPNAKRWRKSRPGRMHSSAGGNGSQRRNASSALPTMH